MPRKKANLSYANFPRKVLEAVTSKTESRALRTYLVLSMYYSTEFDYIEEVNRFRRPFVGHSRIAKLLKISVSQVKNDLRILSNMRDENDKPVVIIHHRFNSEENIYYSNEYELPHVEEILLNFKGPFDF